MTQHQQFIVEYNDTRQTMSMSRHQAGEFPDTPLTYLHSHSGDQQRTLIWLSGCRTWTFGLLICPKPDNLPFFVPRLKWAVLDFRYQVIYPTAFLQSIRFICYFLCWAGGIVHHSGFVRPTYSLQDSCSTNYWASVDCARLSLVVKFVHMLIQLMNYWCENDVIAMHVLPLQK